MIRKILTAITLIFAIALPAGFISADHNTGGTEASHATTVHHDDEDADHDDDHVQTTGAALSDAERMEKMESLINILTQLIDLLKYQLEHQSAGMHAAGTDDADHDADMVDDHVDHEDDSDGDSN